MDGRHGGTDLLPHMYLAPRILNALETQPRLVYKVQYGLPTFDREAVAVPECHARG